MKVLHVISSFGAGGAESLVRDLSIALAKRHFQVAVAVFSNSAEQNSDRVYEQTMREQLLAHGVSLFHLGHRSRSNFISGALKLRKFVTEFQPDIIHIHIARALLLRLFTFCSIPTVYTHHSSRFNFPTQLFHLFNVVTDAYIAISNANRQILDGVGCKNVVTIPNGIDGSRMRTNGERDQSSRKIILSVGSIVDAKDYDTLIDVAQIVKNELSSSHMNVKFIVAGDGKKIDEYRAKVRSRSLAELVHFTGARTDVSDLMHGAYMLLMTSRVEGMPITLIEAMHAGLPAVCTEVGACTEVVESGFNGESSAPGDAPALAKNVLKLLNDEALRNRYGTNARVSADSFSIEKSVRSHADLYSSVIAARRDTNGRRRIFIGATG